MPDQACFMAAYGPLSSVDVMMAPAFMSSSEKWVILIENTLPCHQQMGQLIWFRLKFSKRICILTKLGTFFSCIYQDYT